MTGPIDPSALGGTPADVVAALGRAQAPSGDQDEQEPPRGSPRSWRLARSLAH